ncbi:uncharacterized protein M437DRAFT_77661 [Aureobasidium melanogenum CBS 110374]|uniref:Uncharacterized protein n=1 Tax=Aureobasidium melanogenum (strain CBS 110374) TaxID=1043003 RepID=A0A074VRC9_AURM1|nr:uncharacterized protein M437DRAFT_77661 [Aureobasidium melanogenum CBS 110374]KEQ60237.1 hypothetical protein M437DRAFT_77661 [Aureobasidium melanogenum CBS 110374]
MASQDALFGGALLCHSILKFSHSTLPRSANPSGWNHIQTPDLFTVIEQLNRSGIQLRIIHGTNDLEVLPLTAIIQETKELHRRQPNRSPDNLPIFGLTKGTALAIRYFCQNNQVRRIQLRFPDEASCNETVQLLSAHGLMFSVPNTKPNTQTQARPVTANSYLNRQPSVQSARFDHATSSIIVPTIQGMTIILPSVNQDEPSRMHPFTSSQGPKEYDTRSIQRQPTFAPIRTSEGPVERPSTAPIEWPSDMTRKMLPPRRELPFPKPSSSPAKTKTLPPLPKPSYVSEAAKPDRSVPEENSSRASPENKTEHGITRLTTPRGPTRFEPPASRMYNFNPKDDPMVVDSPGTSETITLAHMSNQDVLADSDQRCGSSVSPVYFTGSSPEDKLPSSPERSFFSSRDQMTSSSPSERRSQRLAQKHIQQDTEMQDMGMTTSSTQQSAQDALRQYAEQPKETRAEAIKQFILASLHDDDFLKLCVDVEACWQRQVLDRRV